MLMLIGAEMLDMIEMTQATYFSTMGCRTQMVGILMDLGQQKMVEVIFVLLQLFFLLSMM